jgi:hypothetical protein
MKIFALRKPPAWGLLISAILIGLWSLYAYVSGKFIFGNKYHAHVTVVYRSKDPEEFSMWLNLSAISFAVLYALTFLKIDPLEKQLVIASSWIRTRRDSMLSKSPPWWAYLFWGIIVLLTLYFVYFGITQKQQ